METDWAMIWPDWSCEWWEWNLTREARVFVIALQAIVNCMVEIGLWSLV